MKFYNHYDASGYTTDTAVALEENEVSSWFKRCENLSEEASLCYATGYIESFDSEEEATARSIETDARTRRLY